MIRPQFSLDLSTELIVDNFAGGGGASTGIELALGRHVDIAVNHDPEAIAMHNANHPQTEHLCENVFDVDPCKVIAGRPVGLAWFSPDCTHFSKARGTKPRSKKIRGLAWIIVRWAYLVRPRVIMMENVEEFLTWGPLADDGQPCPKNKGRTFNSFHLVMTTGVPADCPDIPEIIETVGRGITVADLRRGLGYDFQFREERACNHAAPTIRKRLFGIARCDGAPIVWPEHTHGDPRSPAFKKSGLQPWRTAAECIDWRVSCPSIFERVRPLAEATCRRIAKGIMRHVVNDPAPFIVPLTHQGDVARDYPLDQPAQTVTGAHRGEMALITPVITEHANASSPRCNRPDMPLRTQCAGVKGGHFAVIAPILAETAHGEESPKGVKRWGSGERSAKMPLNTVNASSGNTALVSAFLAKHYGGHEGSGWPLGKPISTITGIDHHGLVAAHITKFRKGSSGASAKEPMPTVTANSFIKRPGGSAPLGVVSSHLAKLRGTSIAQDLKDPLHTISAGGNHFAEVRAFLIKYYGSDQDPQLREPMHTATTKDRFGLVTIKGEEFAIVDIGLRMLTPRELFNAQGFPADYIIGDDGRAGLKLTKTAQVRMCGNSVCPPMAAALVRANVPELVVWTAKETRKRSA